MADNNTVGALPFLFRVILLPLRVEAAEAFARLGLLLVSDQADLTLHLYNEDKDIAMTRKYFIFK